MAKVKYVFLLTSSFLFLLGYLFFYLKNFYLKKTSQFVSYSIDGRVYNLLVAKTKEEHQKGLMFYRNKKDLKGADGMIFVFSDKDYRVFWNKNTFLDLDIYWIDEDRVVGKDFLPSIEKTKEIFTLTSPKPVDRVVEIVR